MTVGRGVAASEQTSVVLTTSADLLQAPPSRQALVCSRYLRGTAARRYRPLRALGALASVPAWGIPVVAMAMPVDPILTAIERDRVADVAFAAS